MFDTKYTRMENSKEFVSNSGSEYLTLYEYRISKDGVKNLVPCGKKNIQELIDASLDSVDINILMEKFINGDNTALDRVKGVYMDCRNMPETYAELFDRNERCRELFDALPTEIKEKFNNSYTEFWSSYGSETFMRVVNPESVNVIEKENIENESNESK